MLRKKLVLACVAGLLTGCVVGSADPAPTPYPADYLPTVIHLTAQSIDATNAAATTLALPPSPGPTLTPSRLPPSPVPSVTPTPLPGVPLAAVQINSPGPMSRVVSPLDVRLYLATGKNTEAEIDLFGEDGTLLARQLMYVPGPASAEYIFLKIPFQIRPVSETGILQVSTRDGAGVLVALNTVRFLLLSTGVSQINPPGNDIYERIALETPRYQSTVSGGMLTVRGTYQAFNLQPLVLELVDQHGKSLFANRLLTFSTPGLQILNTTIPYKVSSPTPAYLVIHQQDDQLKNPVFLANQASNVLLGPVYLFSQTLTLNP